MSSTTVISSTATVVTEVEDEAPETTKVACTAHGCNQTFSNAGELAIHKQKHQMTLKLGSSRTGLTDMLPFDQTPTPTKFLQFGKETGLFDEISSNPFDNEFKRNTSSGQSLKEKARRSAVPGLIINNHGKARTPTSYPSSSQMGLAPIAQPVHVITLTPTLPSPVISGGQFFLPPLPSPQGFLPSPAALISPSIVPFSAPGLPFPTMQAVVEAQHAALTQAFMNAAAVANPPTTIYQSGDSNTSFQVHMPRTSSVTELQSSAPAPFPTQTVSVPVNHNHTPPTCHAMLPVGQMAAPPVGSASVIQQHGHVNMEQQRRPLSQSNSLDHPNHSMSTIMERKPSFHGETSVITQAPANSSSAQLIMNPNNMNIMHQVSSAGYQYMPSQTNVPPFAQLAADIAGRMPSHPALTSSRSVPTQSHNNMQQHPHLPHQNSLPNIDAKQKLKETLASNNPNLHIELPNVQRTFAIKEEEGPQNEVSSSSGNGTQKTPGRRRGRQSEMDPDRKRMRFLERNRAAASRCRAKKKQWVSGLEVKAKDLSNSNVTLQSEVATLREEVASLKQLLLAHRDCPITRLQQQKVAIAGGDPAVVVSNPVQAAASLRIMAEGENHDTENSMLTSTDEDIKPNSGSLHMSLASTASNGSFSDSSLDSVSLQMQPSVLVNMNQALKAEPPSDGFQQNIPQPTNTSTIVLNNSYSGAPTLSTTAST